MKRILCLILCIGLLLPAMSGFAASDYESHWANEYIELLRKNSIISGDTDGSMRPEDSITRAEFAQVTNKAFGYTDAGSETFNDISSDAWYFKAMSIALKSGYFKGDENKNGNPEKRITRAEAATAFARILKLDTSDASTDFADDAEIPSWAKGAVKALSKAGIINGYSDGSYKPYSDMKRAEYFTVVAKNILSEDSGDKEIKEEVENDKPVSTVVHGVTSGGGGGGGGGGGSSSPSVQVTAAPTGLFYNMDTGYLSWDTGYNVTSYDGIITRTTENKSGSASFSTSAIRYDIYTEIANIMSADRAENESFEIKLRANGSYGASEYSSISVSLTNPVVPIPEFNLSQTFGNDGSESISLNWTASPLVSSYTISAEFDEGIYEPLTISQSNDSTSLSATQIGKIKGTHNFKISVVSNDPQYLDVTDKIVEVELPLFGGVENIGTDEFTLIYNDRHFKNISDKALNYKLMADILLSSHTPIDGYKATFEGNGKKVTLTSGAANGLFLSTTADAVIKNLTVAGTIVNTGEQTAAIVASNSGSIENCVNEATVNGAKYTGGITAINQKKASITDCYNKGTIVSSSQFTGGIAGQNFAEISRCGNTASVTASAQTYVGGITGYTNGSVIEFCYNTGAIKGGTCIGGIAGDGAGTNTISNCFNAADINSGSAAVGGILGRTLSGGDTITNCYNIGALAHSSTDYTTDNGILGTVNKAGSIINYCYYLSDAAAVKADVTVNNSSNLTEEEMSDISNYDSASWDFAEVWQAGNTDYPFPKLVGLVFDFVYGKDSGDNSGGGSGGESGGGSGSQTAPEGSEGNPYKISSVADFEKIITEPAACYELTTDITLDTALAISDFAGVFDGKGYTLTFNNTTCGLFVSTKSTATVKNVITAGSITNTGENTGAIVSINKGTIINCENKAAVSGYKTTGGIAGKNQGTIESCVNSGIISADNQFTGGIAGWNRVKITKCVNTGNITSGSSYVGGITGYAQGDNGTETSKCYNSATVSGTKSLGGIVGNAAGTNTISDCYNSGVIATTNENTIGGILGVSTSGKDTISNCHNVGEVKTKTGTILVNNPILNGRGASGSDTVQVNNCYYLSDTAMADKANVSFTSTSNLSATDFANSSKFVGWDFENVWEIKTIEGKTYPVLKNITK